MKKVLISLVALVGLSIAGCGQQQIRTQIVYVPTTQIESVEATPKQEAIIEEITKVPSFIVVQSEQSDVLNIKSGTNYQLEGQVHYKNGEIDDRIQWKSTDQTVVSVNEVTGLVIATGEGKASIFAHPVDDVSMSIEIPVFVKK